MNALDRFQHNVSVISAALDRHNNGMELYQLCKELVKHEKVRTAAPLSMSLLEEAVERYARDNFNKPVVGDFRGNVDA